MTDQIIAPGLLPAANDRAAADVLKIIVTVHGREVVLHFSEPREFVALTGLAPAHIGAKLMINAVAADDTAAQSVLDLCMALIDSVYEQRGDLKPAGGAVKHELIERHRATLTNRLRIVLNSTREKKKIDNAALAKQLVEVMLKEVFS